MPFRSKRRRSIMEDQPFQLLHLTNTHLKIPHQGHILSPPHLPSQGQHITCLCPQQYYKAEVPIWLDLIAGLNTPNGAEYIPLTRGKGGPGRAKADWLLYSVFPPPPNSEPSHRTALSAAPVPSSRQRIADLGSPMWGGVWFAIVSA